MFAYTTNLPEVGGEQAFELLFLFISPWAYIQYSRLYKLIYSLNKLVLFQSDLSIIKIPTLKFLPSL